MYIKIYSAKTNVTQTTISSPCIVRLSNYAGRALAKPNQIHVF